MPRMNMKELKRSFLRKYRRLPKLLRTLVYWAFFILVAGIGDYFLIYILASLTSQKLIDWRTVLSFLVVEVLAAVIAKLLKVGQESDSEQRYQRILMASSKAQLVPQFAHLQALYLESEEFGIEYPDSQSRIVNTKTKIGYWVPSYIDDLVQEEIIQVIKFKEKAKLEEYLKNNNITTALHYPRDDELDIWQTQRGSA
jgi:hypothetical protein